MEKLVPDQRNYFYLIEAARAGIHKPILAALYAVHQQPQLTDGEVGLGIAPANRIAGDAVNTFPEQVQYAANTIRSITDHLTAKGWSGQDLWSNAQGRYSDRFVRAIAEGYMPPASDTAAARLEEANPQKLLDAYLADLEFDYRADQLPQNLTNLDKALLQFVERVPRYYNGLSAQREALLEMLRLWRKLDTREAAIQSLAAELPPGNRLDTLDETHLDKPLLQFAQNASRFYSGYPHQREALIRLAQIWRQQDSREEAIATLSNFTSNETNLQIVDPALIAFAQRIPSYYQGKGNQRFALTEAFRVWQQLDSRETALGALGINLKAVGSSNSTTAIANAAAQVDQELLNFIRRIPTTYEEKEIQREALIRLVQLWRGLEARDVTIQSLFADLKRMERANRESPDAPPRPQPAPLPPRPSRWTPQNIRLELSILPNGSFTWAEATHGGTRMPPDQATVDAMVRIAKLAQQARDRIGRPFHVTSWYRPPEINRRVGGAAFSRHIVGDAIDFYVPGLTGNQLYWALDPWWPGGLGRYRRFPQLSHIDARSYRARWIH